MKIFELLKQIKICTYQFLYHRPYGTKDIIDIKRIIVSKEFLKSYPSPIKIRKYYDFYNDHKYFDKPIVVRKLSNSSNGRVILVDGYIRFGLAHLMKLKCVPVKWVKD